MTWVEARRWVHERRLHAQDERQRLEIEYMRARNEDEAPGVLAALRDRIEHGWSMPS